MVIHNKTKEQVKQIFREVLDLLFPVEILEKLADYCFGSPTQSIVVVLSSEDNSGEFQLFYNANNKKYRLLYRCAQRSKIFPTQHHPLVERREEEMEQLDSCVRASHR